MMYLLFSLLLFSCFESKNATPPVNKPTPSTKSTSKSSVKSKSKVSKKASKAKSKSSTNSLSTGDCKSLMVDYEKQVDSYLKTLIPAIKGQKPSAEHLEQSRKFQKINMEFANKKKQLAREGKFTLECSKKNNEIMLKMMEKGTAASGKPMDSKRLEKGKKSMDNLAELQNCMKNCKTNSDAKAMTACMKNCGEKAREKAKQ